MDSDVPRPPMPQRSIFPPRAAGLIERPRLMEKLRAVAEHKLTLISAPPGYGKTTLAAQFARQSPYPVVWHTVEERERDVPNLYAACLNALSTLVPDVKALQKTTGLSPAEQAVALADYLRDHVTSHFVYIIDDVHHLAASLAAETWLRSFVARMPPRCHLMLISRILPDLPLAEMIARREVLAVGQHELRFNMPEIHSLAFDMLGAPPPLEAIEQLAVRLEGWPAGTVLALHPLPSDLERAMLSGGEGPEALFDVLADSMLHAQPPDMRNFLLASSTLMLVTPELCTHALELQNSAEMLHQAQVRNLFLARASGGLVYHTLFRNFLQRRMKTQKPSDFTVLHLKAAHWFERHDQIDSAVDHYIVAGYGSYAAALMERVARSYFAQGKIETLLRWYTQGGCAPTDMPLLSYICGAIYTDRYEYTAAEAALDQAEYGLKRQGQDASLLDVQLQRAMISLQRGQYELAAEQARAIIEQRSTVSSTIRGRALRVWGFALIRSGQVEKGTALLEEAVPLHRASGDAYALTNLLQDMEIAYTRLGKPEAAAECLQEVVALRRSLGGAGALALALNNLGYYYHQHSDYVQAMATLQEGLSVVARTLNRRAESYLLWSMGDIQRDRGAFSEAQQIYYKALEVLGNSEPNLRCAILLSLSTLQRWRCNARDAFMLAEEAAALASAHNISLEGVLAHAMICVLRAELWPHGGALTELESVIEELHSAKQEQARLLGLCAYLALRTGDRSGAGKYLLSAIELAQGAGGMQPLVAEVWHVETLRDFVGSHPRRFHAVEHPLKALRAAQVHKVYSTRAGNRAIVPSTFSLRVYTLGAELIERDGERIATSNWRATKARELFLYLLFYGPESRAQIGLTFWPEGTQIKVRRSFHTTLYRIRQALGENVISFLDERYMINPEVSTWCDSRELENLVTQARLLSLHDARTEDLWRRAVALYNGPFLPSLNADWINLRRDAMEELYLEALLGLGECLRARGDTRGAIESFKRALEIDCYREDIHRAVMSCYGDLGEKKAILVHLHELQTLLFRDLAIKPSAETMALAHTLLN